MIHSPRPFLGSAVVALAACALLASRPLAAGESYRILKGLTRFGNRHAGAPLRAEAVNRLEKLMEQAGLSVIRQPFAVSDPKDGRPWEMVNLIGSYRPESPCRVLLGSHFDTRHLAEQDLDPSKRTLPIEGANDGSSGAAVLLALAKRFPKILPSGLGVDVVLFDGEEMGYPGIGGYCAGSRRFTRDLDSLKKKPKLGIILDMVCSPSGVFKMEPHSLETAPALVDALWEIGEKAAPQAFSRKPSEAILDDHSPLTAAGIPAALLIAFDYPHWHKSSDTLRRCSPRRLDLVENTLAELLSEKILVLAGCLP